MFDVIWANRYELIQWTLDLITIVSVIYGNDFFLSWSELVPLVQMAIYGENSYLGHIFKLESVIVTYSKHPHRWGDWQPHIHLKTLDSSAPEHNPRKEDNAASSCNSRSSNRDGDKETKLTYSFKGFSTYFFFTVHQIKPLNTFTFYYYLIIKSLFYA